MVRLEDSNEYSTQVTTGSETDLYGTIPPLRSLHRRPGCRTSLAGIRRLRALLLVPKSVETRGVADFPSSVLAGLVAALRVPHFRESGLFV